MASLLYYCGPVIAMILSPLMFKERLTLPKIAGFVAVLAGVFLVNGDSVLHGVNISGMILGLLSAFTYFLMVTLNKQSRSIASMENSVIQLTVSFLTVAVFVGFKQHFVIKTAPSDWPWILVLGLLNTGLGCYLYFSPLSKLPVQTVAVFGYLEALSAVVFSAVFLHERMTWLQIAGAVLIIGGAMFGQLIHIEKRDAGLRKEAPAHDKT